MQIDPSGLKPLFLQIAEGIEDDILNDILREKEPAYSQYQVSREFNINPATAAKGISVLVSEGILYKVRGLGMYVSEGARNMIREKRKKAFFETLLKDLLLEAEKLGISLEEIKKMIDQSKGGREG